jgi:hypothetical protein
MTPCNNKLGRQQRTTRPLELDAGDTGAVYTAVGLGLVAELVSGLGKCAFACCHLHPLVPFCLITFDRSKETVSLLAREYWDTSALASQEAQLRERLLLCQ